MGSFLTSAKIVVTISIDFARGNQFVTRALEGFGRRSVAIINVVELKRSGIGDCALISSWRFGHGMLLKFRAVRL